MNRDVSNCNAGAPDYRSRTVIAYAPCGFLTDYSCCAQLESSLASTGASIYTWRSTLRNMDFCHVR